MNIIEIIEGNEFLKRIFPNGIDNFFIGQLNLSCFDRFELVIHVKKEIQFDVPKWGKWGQDFNVVTIELLGSMVGRINVMNWKSNSEDTCTCIINKLESGKTILIFKDDINDWMVEIELGEIVFQRCSTYLL